MMRFVSGTRFTGPELTRGVLGRTSADARRLLRRPEPAEADRLRVTFDDGTAQVVDHALLATGFRIDIRRLPFLPPELAEAIAVDRGYPLLKRGFESSVPGLHFVGAPAARSFGPVMRFVSGTRFTGPELTRGVLGRTSADARRLLRRPEPAEPDVARSA